MRHALLILFSDRFLVIEQLLAAKLPVCLPENLGQQLLSRCLCDHGPK